MAKVDKSRLEMLVNTSSYDYSEEVKRKPVKKPWYNRDILPWIKQFVTNLTSKFSK